MNWMQNKLELFPLWQRRLDESWYNFSDAYIRYIYLWRQKRKCLFDCEIGDWVSIHIITDINGPAHVRGEVIAHCIDSLLGFGQNLCVPYHPRWFWIPTLNKRGPSMELPSLWGMWVRTERLLMTHPKKHRVKDSIGQFLHLSWQLFCHGDKKKNLHVYKRCWSLIVWLVTLAGCISCDSLFAVWRITECWPDRVSDELGSISQNPLPSHSILPYHICWEGLPRTG